jgi:O-antigen ligase
MFKKAIAQAPLAFLASTLVAMFFYEFAKAWLSISMIGILLSMLLLMPIKQIVSNFYSKRHFFLLSLSGVFLFLFLPQSDNISYGWNRIELRGALLALCIAFASMKELTKKQFLCLMILYVLLSVSFVTYVLYGYILDFETINQRYLHAQVMPTPLNHVRFSLMVAMAAYISYIIVYHEFIKEKWATILMVFATLYLITFLHIYAVRSGLLAIYVLLIFEVLRMWILQKNRWPMFLLIGVSSITLFTSIALFPTLTNKIKDTRADIITYQNKTYPNYSSLTTRLISFDAAIHQFKEHPLVGCGIGDIKDASDAYFRKNYPTIDTPILPHNQFLFFLAATGIIGLCIFVATFYAPLWFVKARQNKLLLAQYLILGVAFMTEPMLETQLGMAFSIIFILIPLVIDSDSFALLQSK